MKPGVVPSAHTTWSACGRRRSLASHGPSSAPIPDTATDRAKLRPPSSLRQTRTLRPVPLLLGDGGSVKSPQTKTRPSPSKPAERVAAPVETRRQRQRPVTAPTPPAVKRDVRRDHAAGQHARREQLTRIAGVHRKARRRMVVVAVVADPHVGGHRVRAGPSSACEPAGRQPRGTDESATAEVAPGDRERIHRTPRIVRKAEIKLIDSRFFSQASGSGQPIVRHERPPSRVLCPAVRDRRRITPIAAPGYCPNTNARVSRDRRSRARSR